MLPLSSTGPCAAAWEKPLCYIEIPLGPTRPRMVFHSFFHSIVEKMLKA